MTRSLPWIQKYQPKTVRDIQGHIETIHALKAAVLAKKPCLLYGPIGSGKTSSVIALARDLSYELIEVNASDTRNKEQIEQIIGHSLQQQSLFFQGKLILIDEVDGISGNSDRGGLPTLQKLIEHPAHAVVLTANDPWDSKFSTLRKKTYLVEFQPLSISHIVQRLQFICQAENILSEESVLKNIARRSGGDLRAAINDLQQIGEGKEKIVEDDLAVLGDREREQNILDALKLVFKSCKAEDVLQAFDSVDLELDEIFLWIDENLPKEYRGEALEKAYASMSKADIFRRRITRWQHWRFLVYIYALLTAGVAVAKQEKNPGFVEYKRSGRLLKIWIANQKKAKKKAIAQKLGEDVHGSVKEILYHIIPYLQIMLRYNKKETFGLEKEEIEVLLK